MENKPDKLATHDCPRCGLPQEDNGLIAWCAAGHVLKLAKLSMEDKKLSDRELKRARIVELGEMTYFDLACVAHARKIPNTDIPWVGTPRSFADVMQRILDVEFPALAAVKE